MDLVHELHLLVNNAFNGMFFVILCLSAKSLLRFIYYISVKVNKHFVQKLVQIYSARGIIDMSKGGRTSYDKELYKQRSSQRKRSF